MRDYCRGVVAAASGQRATVGSNNSIGLGISGSNDIGWALATAATSGQHDTVGGMAGLGPGHGSAASGQCGSRQSVASLGRRRTVAGMMRLRLGVGMVRGWCAPTLTNAAKG